MKVVGLIPSRLESQRLPEKALADICGLPMVVHVFKRCQLANSLDEVYVVTDNQKIKEAVESNGGQVIMTRSDHQTGTDRLAEAIDYIDCDIAVNIQGDEALVDPKHIDKVVQALLDDENLNVGILACPFSKENSPSDIKLVLNEASNVMYASRADIPFDRDGSHGPNFLKAYHIVPFRKAFLQQYASWPKTALEKIESNEYLRILEKGFKIRAVQVESDAISVDTPADLEFVQKQMAKDKVFSSYSL